MSGTGGGLARLDLVGLYGSRELTPQVVVGYNGKLYSPGLASHRKEDWLALAAGMPGTRLEFDVYTRLWVGPDGSLHYSYDRPPFDQVEAQAGNPSEILAALSRDIASRTWPGEG
jgi:hypothetical protein